MPNTSLLMDSKIKIIYRHVLPIENSEVNYIILHLFSAMIKIKTT